MGLSLPFAAVLAAALLQASCAARLSFVKGSSSARHKGGLRRAAAHDKEKDDEPICSCDCCSVVERRPDEVVSGAMVKCAPASGHSEDTCTPQCVPSWDDQILRYSSEEQILDYERFCFFECKPAPGSMNLAVGAGCVVLEPAEARQVLDKNGNAIDPAIVYASAMAGPPLPPNEQAYPGQQTLLANHAGVPIQDLPPQEDSPPQANADPEAAQQMMMMNQGVPEPEATQPMMMNQGVPEPETSVPDQAAPAQFGNAQQPPIPDAQMEYSQVPNQVPNSQQMVVVSQSGPGAPGGLPDPAMLPANGAIPKIVDGEGAAAGMPMQMMGGKVPPQLRSAHLLPPAYPGAPQVWVEQPTAPATPQQASLLGEKAELRGGRRATQTPTEIISADGGLENSTEVEQDGGSAEDWVIRAKTMAARARKAASAVRAGLPPLGEDPSNVKDPFALIADIRRAADETESAADRSAEWADKAVEATSDSEAVNARTARYYAERQIQNASRGEVPDPAEAAEMNASAAVGKVGALEKSSPEVLKSSWQYRAAAAAAEASKPYLDLIKHTQYVAWQYNNTAKQDEKKAADMKQQSTNLMDEADHYHRLGLEKEAKFREAEAAQVKKDAEKLILQAQLNREKAAKATENVTIYYKSAQKAAAWAGANLPLPAPLEES